MNEYNPKPGDVEKLSYYPSGAMEEKKIENQGQPANGWSRTVYFEDGSVKLQECFSHSLLIERIEYSEAGEKVAHKIYSHSQKQLVDRPVLKPYKRPNVVVGFGHMGFYFKNLPEIAAFIGADYDEASLDKAYQDYLNDINNSDPPDEDHEDKEYRWSLPGKRMSFALWFERHEMLYQWQLWARSEEDYEEAGAFMASLKGA